MVGNAAKRVRSDYTPRCNMSKGETRKFGKINRPNQIAQLTGPSSKIYLVERRNAPLAAKTDKAKNRVLSLFILGPPIADFFSITKPKAPPFSGALGETN